VFHNGYGGNKIEEEIVGWLQKAAQKKQLNKGTQTRNFGTGTRFMKVITSFRTKKRQCGGCIRLQCRNRR